VGKKVTNKETRISQLTPDQFKALVREAVRAELSEAGLRLDDTNHQYEAREDFRFLRNIRTTLTSWSSRVGALFITAVFGGLIWLVMTGFKLFVHKG